MSLELICTAYDLSPFAEDMGYHGEPFRWDEVRRAQLRAELDAYCARLYGLTRDELRYILLFRWLEETKDAGADYKRKNRPNIRKHSNGSTVGGALEIHGSRL